MKKLLILSCLLLSACGDVPLNQNASTLIQNYHERQNMATKAQQDSYYYLLGIGASDEPLQAGRAYSDELQALLKQNASEDDVLALNEEYSLNQLSIPNTNDTELFCHIENNYDAVHDCFNKLLSKKN